MTIQQDSAPELCLPCSRGFKECDCREDSAPDGEGLGSKPSALPTEQAGKPVLALHHEPLVCAVRETVEVMRITLCGSTRFRDEYELWNKRLTLAGFLVYSVSGFGHSGDVFTDEEKSRLDQIHLAKIDASHAVVVINPGGYIGASTAREIEHARASGKDVYFLSHGRTVYQLRTGPDGAGSLRYRAFDWSPRLAAISPAEQVGTDEPSGEGVQTTPEAERDALRLAILGGEDVPGVAATVSVEQCVKFLLEERQVHEWSAEQQAELDTARADLARKDAALSQVGPKARQWAGFYPEASDGRNTFIMFAEWAEGLHASARQALETKAGRAS
ncbi:hypothetical protein [Brevundimonas sp. Root1279]|uniref:hypothetical protein n=1 Tax=Brevundimonas sp. Root1279 TaxID=1736443 RepID=UPI000AD79DAC|nr:hypothetical protein [Brevundimonas sp. Root1279]